MVVTENAAVRSALGKVRPVPLAQALFDEAAVQSSRGTFCVGELAQHPLAMQPRNVLLSKVRTVATVRIGGGIRDESGSDRIQMDVAYEFQEVTVGVNQDRLIAPLEQVPAATLVSVHPPRVSKREILDDGGQSDPADLDDQVHMVRHPAVAVHAIPETADPFGNEVFHLPVIPLPEEDGLTAIAAQDDVVYPPGNVDTRFPCHKRHHTRGVSQ